MTAAVEIRIDTSELEQTVDTLGRPFQTREYLPLVGQRFLRWVNDNFRQHGAERPWAPLSPNTVAARRQGRGTGSAQPLRDTGRMAQSFTSEVQTDSVWVGTRDQKATYHHFGTRPRIITPRGGSGTLSFVVAGQGLIHRRYPTKKGQAGVRHPGIPVRPLLPSPHLAEQLAVQVLQVYLDDLVAKVG